MERDPRFVHLRDLGPNIMQVYDTSGAQISHPSFLAQLWDAWSLKRRAARRRKLMPHPKPLRGPLWRVWSWLRYSKEHREKPWGLEIQYDDAHALMMEAKKAANRAYAAAEHWTPEEIRAMQPKGDEFVRDVAANIEKSEYQAHQDFIDLMIDGRRQRSHAAWVYRNESEERRLAKIEQIWREFPDDEKRELNGTKPRRYTTPAPGSILCETCGYRSVRERDVREKYCSRCRMYLDDDIPGRQREIREAVERGDYDFTPTPDELRPKPTFYFGRVEPFRGPKPMEFLCDPDWDLGVRIEVSDLVPPDEVWFAELPYLRSSPPPRELPPA